MAFSGGPVALVARGVVSGCFQLPASLGMASALESSPKVIPLLIQ